MLDLDDWNDSKIPESYSDTSSVEQESYSCCYYTRHKQLKVEVEEKKHVLPKTQTQTT